MFQKYLLSLATLFALSYAVTASEPLERDLQSSNPRVIAEVFECNDQLEELADTTSLRRIGYEIRLCVQPILPTLIRGVVMRSIDDFTFYKNLGSTVQRAIESKGEYDEDTLLLCIPGEVVCSFKTRLNDAFFYGYNVNGTITGAGQVSMQVRDERRLIQARIEFRSNGLRGLQTVTSFAGGFAGIDRIRINIPVKEEKPPAGAEINVTNEEGTWWQDSPGWLKALVIIAAILVFVMLICLCLMCCYAVREAIKERDEEARKKEALEEDEDDTSEEKFSQPTDDDICFDADEHPGTLVFYDVLDETVRSFPLDEPFTQEIFQDIKYQLNERKFFVCDDEDHPDEWREVPEPELMELIEKEWEDSQARMVYAESVQSQTSPIPRKPKKPLSRRGRTDQDSSQHSQSPRPVSSTREVVEINHAAGNTY